MLSLVIVGPMTDRAFLVCFDLNDCSLVDLIDSYFLDLKGKKVD
jgi:hypothetical protein